jgi:serine O-acetyltransferase
LNSDFLKQILIKQTKTVDVPSNETLANWALHLLNLIYPERGPLNFSNEVELNNAFYQSKLELCEILNATKPFCNDCLEAADLFFDQLHELYRILNTDIDSILEGDPAALSKFEIIRCYPGFLAIAIYRIAHKLYKLNIPFIPRILTEYVHSVTGIDIHPGAQIGEYLYIDHGTGLVIGETTVIGHHVKLYQGVTLGALSVEKYMANTKRHPTIGNNVIIYSGATILGGETFIGDNCIIGGNVWLTKSVSTGLAVYHQAVSKIAEIKK